MPKDSKVIVTKHALSRYRQRVDPRASYADAVAALSTPAIVSAAAFGARFVRLATGHRITLKGNVVMTVLPPGNYRKQVQRIGAAKFGRR
jgi:hypothetical protein